MSPKLDPEELGIFLSRTGASDDRVICGARYGEDAAAIDLGEKTLVVSTDPISMSVDLIGTLAVPIACNDIAASGARPSWLTSTIFLDEHDQAMQEHIAEQLHTASAALDVAIVGGHTEYVPTLRSPLLSVTAFGLTDRFVPTGGARPDDRILLTKGAAIEATAILGTDFADELRTAGVPDDTIERAAGFFEDVAIVPEAGAIRDLATAMHDPTEGGILTALFEMAAASSVHVEIDIEEVPIRPATDQCCSAMDIDPLKAIASGALIAAIPDQRVDDALATLEAQAIDAAVIGRVSEGDPTVAYDGTVLEEPSTDAIYALWDAD